MANVNIPRPDLKDLAGASSTQNYMEKLIDELEYILMNLDEDNLTDKFKKKVEES